jgi:asparagine synthase (glutamine-hydrolysing)
MCGIAGFLGGQAWLAHPGDTLRLMTEALRHRGPDDAGQWLDPQMAIALGHRRLSILDLSPEGHQPMVSRSGRFVIVFNGEIYNWQALRAEEAAHGASFRGHSDTEVMLAAIERRGPVAAVQAMAGMFAFALWDREEHRLHLVRDRVGEKPLYYGNIGSAVAFGSELKALRQCPGWSGAIDREALALYLRYAYVPAPRSIYQGVSKVEPATIVTFGPSDGPTITKYWDLGDVVRAGAREPMVGPDDQLLNDLEACLKGTIAQEMLADVPLGAFLSGGIDSSVIVALMQAQSARPIRTFTIGFHEAGYNEAEHAGAVARHLGTDHAELYVTSEEARAVIPRLPVMYDEPFGDSSQIPTHLVAALARSQVTVALSGDGGDELFGGYNRYFLGKRIWRALAPVPPSVRGAAARGIRSLSPEKWGRVLGAAQRLLPPRLRIAHAGDRMHKLADILTVPSADAMYRGLVSQWPDPEALVINAREPATLLTNVALPIDKMPLVERMMFLDTLTYLPEDIMVKVDRAAMAVSLESRAPFLDHRVIELAWRLPMQAKIRDGQGKWALRQILYRYVPQDLVERPKMGFGVPIDAWLRGPLKEWGAALLDPRRLEREGLLRAEPVLRFWAEHQSGRRNRQYPLWAALMFQAWLESQ